jgi:hypothetical protein
MDIVTSNSATCIAGSAYPLGQALHHVALYPTMWVLLFHQLQLPSLTNQQVRLLLMSFKAVVTL